MADSIYSSYPPPLDPAQEQFLLSTIKDWTIQHGLAVRPNPSMIPEEIEKKGVLATNAPVTFFPSPFPRSCFDESRAVQTLYNELYAAIACDEAWLGKVMEE
jgi:glutathione synthase